MPVQTTMAAPADLAGEYLRGVQTAAQIREARSRLQQQQQEFAQRAAQQAQQNQQEHDLQQQRIAVSQAYQQQQVALKKQQLDQVKAVNDAKTANAARQYAARQQWQQGFAAIDADTTKTEAEKDAAKTSFTMRLAPMMGIPGTEAASMLKDMRPPKPTVPASVDSASNPDYYIATAPNGSQTWHAKPRAAASGADNVKIRIQKDAPPTTMSRKQAQATIPNLDAELQKDPVNLAVMPPPSTPFFSGVARTGAAPTKAPAGPRGEPPPKPGDVDMGYVFKGGNPNDKKNWQKMEE